MPFLIAALLGITTIGTGVLVFDKAGDVVDDKAQKGIVIGAAFIGLYAAYKLIKK